MNLKKENFNVHFNLLEKFSFTNRISLKRFIHQLFKKERKTILRLDYIFCSDDYLLKINQEFLDHDYLTDIISFDLSANHQSVTGEIYISIDRIKENARRFDTSFSNELFRVMFHGALHLCGYNDKTNHEKSLMTKKEDYYLNLYKRFQQRST